MHMCAEMLPPHGKLDHWQLAGVQGLRRMSAGSLSLPGMLCHCWLADLQGLPYSLA